MLKAKLAGDRLSIIATTKEDQEDLLRWVLAVGNGEWHGEGERGVIMIGTAAFLLSDQWRIDLDLLAPAAGLQLEPAESGQAFSSVLHQVLYSARKALGRFFDPSCGGCG